jgi:HK97 family phage prohead protease
MKNDREYRSMTMSIEERDDDKKIVTGYATTFDDPYLLWTDDEVEVWEVVDRNAFANTDMDDVIMQYDHQGRVFARKRNNTLEINPDDKGLFIRADLGGTDIGRELYQEIEGGYTDRMSFGFTVKDQRRDIEERENGKTKVTRFVLSVGKLFDVSAVSLPANPNTSIISARFLDGVIEEVRAERLKAQELKEERDRLMKRAKALGGTNK